MNILRSFETVIMDTTFAFATRTGTGTTPCFLFFLIFHNKIFDLMNKLFNFALENRKGGRVSPPSGLLPLNREFDYCDKPDSETDLELCFHCLFGFHFSYSFQGFRNPLCQSLLTIQSYELILKYANFFKIIFTFSAFFFTFLSLINQS